MTGVGAYTFDFKKEVKSLLRELGPQGDHMIFLTAHVDGDEIKLRNFMGAPETLRLFRRQVGKSVKAYYQEDPRRSSAAYREVPAGATGPIVAHVCLRDNDFGGFFGKESRQLKTLFSLWHETGHCLIYDGPWPDKKHPYHECAADAYAALRLLQRFGHEAVDMISKISWYRSYCAIVGDTNHLSTPVLDKIIADSTDTDFSRLDHEQTVALARTYAKKWTPRPRMLEQTLAALDNGTFDPTRVYTDVLPAWKNPSDFAFYVGAKILQPMLAEGIEVDDRKLTYDDPESRKMIADYIAQRAEGMSLESIFNKAAKRKTTPVQKALKMPLSKPLRIA